jgi:hypothetical protein
MISPDEGSKADNTALLVDITAGVKLISHSRSNEAALYSEQCTEYYRSI